ncbi:MAG TPA: hypothetical protein VGK89_13015 [Candidatus Eisenbacteria bacterium]
MKRFVIFLLLVVAAWYGWKHWQDIVRHSPSHEAVIENDTGMTMVRIRLTVDGQTLVKEELPNEQRAVLPFKVANDATLRMDWEWKEKLGEKHWTGGMVPRGPMVQRHIIRVDADGGVVYTAEPK